MKLAFPIIAGLLVLFVGIYVSGQLALYEDFPHFDSVMHVFGGAVVGWTLLAYAAVKGRGTPSFTYILGMTLFIGILWEIAEILSGEYLGNTIVYKYFHGGGTIDSISDLAMDILGATIAFIAYPKKLDSFKRFNS
jgi:hypothetical protein